MFYRIVLVFCCFSSSLLAQKNIRGSIQSQKRSGIPYTNIGIINSKIGTVSDEFGNFSLSIPDSLIQDSLTFSSIGYEIKRISIMDLFKEDSAFILLKEKVIGLNEVRISNRKRKQFKLGITGRTPMLSIPSSSYQQNDILEQARLIHVKEPIQVLNANIFVLSDIVDEVSVRINFYALVNGLPGDRIVEKSIIKKIKQPKGWHTFDLSDEHIFLDKDFVLAFEYLPSSKHNIVFAAKVGSSDSYLRKNSLGIWRKNQIGGCSIYATVEN